MEKKKKNGHNRDLLVAHEELKDDWHVVVPCTSNGNRTDHLSELVVRDRVDMHPVQQMVGRVMMPKNRFEGVYNHDDGIDNHDR